ncbi:D-fructose-6-phosphate amidotransferase [Photobacterium sp. SDRW27]|uniref:D-fructose-6-phosphate amidotransferase n=1 Tax=Photobacterium obscurum TaxID=2829490 RepID=UPI0022441B96|nr:D-fructose-6-phosphate amidotransferase [Photobacterium obscurum]MCW8329996.1 D-fructose-6-phosphate amidotransferase [Photobacterium obscurum]
MTASKLYFRDLLGLTLVISAILVMLGSIFGILAILNFYFHEDVLANTYVHESIPLFVFLIPCYLLGKYISRPKWVSEVEEYQLEAAKKASH